MADTTKHHDPRASKRAEAVAAVMAICLYRSIRLINSRQIPARNVAIR